MVLRTSCLRCQISCSGVSVGSQLILKTGSSGAMPVDSMLTSIDLTVKSSRVFKSIFSVGSASRLARKSAAVVIFPGMCDFTKMNCNTKSPAFQGAGGINLVWKNFLSDLLSAMMMVGLVAPQKLCPDSPSPK